MDFLSSKRGRILLMAAVISLFAFVVWPFLRGGRSLIRTDFMPMNTQMQAMIAQNSEEPAPEVKPRKSDLKSTIGTEPKGAKGTGPKAMIDPEPKATIDSERKETIDTELKATIHTEPNETMDTELKATGDTVPKETIPAFSSIFTPSVVSNEKAETNLPAARSTGQLDLNTATLKQLDELPGIGESKAKAILDYRLKKGRFSRIEELMEVKGIGEKMLEKLKVFLYVTSS
ncbi:ComEA family DNA-binding protein [Paenibacillus andongensis]|uniref:ComEA family DNA-binding protein n=1 Tax=Paenibacillus andongensis TaxID=2975482 RepID=UPI0021BB493E|nr:helix-hairpin-helix domain-containing protein [Paenibacillus andongensis]